MAGLTIAHADIGYDQSGVEALMKTIKTKIVDQAISELESAREKLVEELKPVWTGQSANNFTENMKTDIAAIAKVLDKTRGDLESALIKTANDMADIDRGLIEKIS